MRWLVRVTVSPDKVTRLSFWTKWGAMRYGRRLADEYDARGWLIRVEVVNVSHPEERMYP